MLLLFLPVMPILVGTSLAILRKQDATAAWVIGAGLLAVDVFVLAVVSVFTPVVR